MSDNTMPEPVAWVRDVDGTGSLHACSKGDPDAIAVYTAEALQAERDRAERAETERKKSIKEWGRAFDKMHDRATTAESALAEARKVIEPFADALDRVDRGGPDNACFIGAALTLGDLRAARAWLQSNPAKGQQP